MRRVPVLLVIVASLLAPNLARANDPTYPITSFLDWLGGTQQALQDGSGTYTFNAGWSDLPEREYEELMRHRNDPPQQQLQVLLDALTHMRPDVPYTHFMDSGDPAYGPDWNHDGQFADTREQTKNRAPGDFDVDVAPTTGDTAYFRYPCLNQGDGWTVHYVSANGSCNKGTPYRLGVVQKLSVIGSRGLTMAAKIWIPSDAFKRGACPAFNGPAYASHTAWNNCVRSSSFSGKRFPGIIINDGLASIQQHYYWLAEKLVADGYIVVTYDPIGQGRSEGNTVDLFGFTLANRGPCQLAGSCVDVQDMARWFTGQTIVRIADSGTRVAPRKSPATNARNPVLPILDTSRIGMTGHSMGAISTLSYESFLALGHGFDGRPLPPIRAAVPMSGALPTSAMVPTLFMTSDYDGSPTTIAPAVLAIELNGANQGIGYHTIKNLYDGLRATKSRMPLELLVLEGGVHTDYADQPPIFRTTWSLGMAGWYQTAWMDCYVKSVASACARAHQPLQHLSKAFASEQDPDGPAGPQPSWCMTVPTEAVLNMTPQEFIDAENGHPHYNCKVR